MLVVMPERLLPQHPGHHQLSQQPSRIRLAQRCPPASMQRVRVVAVLRDRLAAAALEDVDDVGARVTLAQSLVGGGVRGEEGECAWVTLTQGLGEGGGRDTGAGPGRRVMGGREGGGTPEVCRAARSTVSFQTLEQTSHLAPLPPTLPTFH